MTYCKCNYCQLYSHEGACTFRKGCMIAEPKLMPYLPLHPEQPGYTIYQQVALGWPSESSHFCCRRVSPKIRQQRSPVMDCSRTAVSIVLVTSSSSGLASLTSCRMPAVEMLMWRTMPPRADSTREEPTAGSGPMALLSCSA